MFLKHSVKYLRNVQRFFSTFNSVLNISEEVNHAIQKNYPIVALESTIITHGMPYPRNLETALEVERIVRENNAVPATIAILDGRIKVGLSHEEIEYIATRKPKDVVKCSRRDLPYVVAQKRSGGTTVAGTMIIAHMAGIKIFATGGIGGVHFEGQNTLDVSADLIELGRTPVAVVCSGVKSILDIPRTLEYLETQGVCVATYGDADKHFPDFYTRDSGCTVPYNLNEPRTAAELIRTLNDLRMQSGILIAVPIPVEHAANKEEIRGAIDAAISAAKEQGISGKDVTPFLLAAIARITKGSSLAANMALIKNNAAVAARIAYELCPNHQSNGIFLERETKFQSESLSPVVIGASILDMSLHMDDDLPNVLNGATYQTSSKQTPGGVGRNLAEGIFKLYGSANLISIVGNDILGKTLLASMPDTLHTGIQIDEDAKTSMCSVLFDKLGECKLILGNMEIHRKISPDHIMKHQQLFPKTPLIVMDANISTAAMECVLRLAEQYKKPVFYEPTDMRIADSVFLHLPEHLTKQIRFLSPNIYELKKIVETITKRQINTTLDITEPQEKILDFTKNILRSIQKNFDCIIVTLGYHGVLVSLRADVGFNESLFDSRTGAYLVWKDGNEESSLKQHHLRYYSASRVENIKNVSGAGDSFSSGLITGLLKGKTVEESVMFGLIAAECSLKSDSAIPKQYFSSNELDVILKEKVPKVEITDL